MTFDSTSRYEISTCTIKSPECFVISGLTLFVSLLVVLYALTIDIQLKANGVTITTIVGIMIGAISSLYCMVVRKIVKSLCTVKQIKNWYFLEYSEKEELSNHDEVKEELCEEPVLSIKSQKKVKREPTSLPDYVGSESIRKNSYVSARNLQVNGDAN